MKALTTSCLVFLLLLGGLLSGIVSAQVPTADSFIPVVQGGPSEVKHADQVAISGNVVTAATAQDAINAAVQHNVRDLATGDTPEVGAKMVDFKSGIGFVASGVSAYRTMTNPVATRIAKRKAYVIAFTAAKKNLAEILSGLSNEGKETVRESLININLPDEEMTNISTNSEEALRQAVDMMLRGFVIYEVKDDTAQNSVYVSIVTTPKTRSQLTRPAPNVVEADDIRDGLNQVITEVRTGLVPPVGGRIISMRATGETAMVGFGSSVVRTSSHATVQAKHNLNAQKVARMHAKDALCGLITGDRASWEGSVVESLQDEVQEFESLRVDDPLARKDPTAVRKFEEARDKFVARMETNDVYRSARSGTLPAGVTTKSWFDGDQAWAYAMSVYVPSVTALADKTRQEMQNGKILQAFTDKDKPDTTSRPGDNVKSGPTGKISPDDDL